MAKRWMNVLIELVVGKSGQANVLKQCCDGDNEIGLA